MALRLMFVGGFFVDHEAFRGEKRVGCCLEQAFVRLSPFQGWSVPVPLEAPHPWWSWLRIVSGSGFLSKVSDFSVGREGPLS